MQVYFRGLVQKVLLPELLDFFSVAAPHFLDLPAMFHLQLFALGLHRCKLHGLVLHSEHEFLAFVAIGLALHLQLVICFLRLELGVTAHVSLSECGLRSGLKLLQLRVLFVGRLCGALVYWAQGIWRLLCSSFLVVTCFLIRDYDILPKKELHRRLQVSGPSKMVPQMFLAERKTGTTFEGAGRRHSGSQEVGT